MMFLSEQLSNSISAALEKFTGTQRQLRILKHVSGGSINQCYQLEWGGMQLFLKVNSSLRFPEMFQMEAKGLERISATNSMKAPAVIAFDTAGEEQFLLIEWIEIGKNSSAS
jgi:hypothetical protein